MRHWVLRQHCHIGFVPTGQSDASFARLRLLRQHRWQLLRLHRVQGRLPRALQGPMGGPYRTVCPATGCANTGSGANADGQLQVRREQVRPRRGGYLEGALQLRL